MVDCYAQTVIQPAIPGVDLSHEQGSAAFKAALAAVRIAAARRQAAR